MEEARMARQILKDGLDGIMTKSVPNLLRVWSDMGLTGENQIARSGVVVQHIDNLLEEMIKEEKDLHARLVENIKKFSVEVDEISKALNLPKYQARDGTSVVQLEKELRLRAGELCKLRYARAVRQKQLCARNKQLRRALGLPSFQLDPSALLATRQLDDMEQEAQRLEGQRTTRLETFRATRADVVKLLEDMERGPDSSFERDVVCDDEADFVLSDDNMRQLGDFALSLSRERADNLRTAAALREQIAALWDELGVEDQTRRSFTAKFFGCRPKTIKALQDELSALTLSRSNAAHRALITRQQELGHLWDRCLVTQELRGSHDHLMAATADVRAVELELGKVKKYYEGNRDVLDRVCRHQELYKELADLELRAGNRENMFTEGRNLLKEEKRKGQVKKELAVAEQEALCAIDQWEKASGRAFTLNNARFKDHVQRQRDRLNSDKAEDQLRCLQNKIKAGSKVGGKVESAESTPLGSLTKRRFACMTPTKIAAKLRKVEEGMRGSSAPSPSGGRSTIMHKMMESPGRLKFDAAGFVIPREPVVITRVRPLSELSATPSSTGRMARVNHGALFTPSTSSLPPTPLSNHIATPTRSWTKKQPGATLTSAPTSIRPRPAASATMTRDADSMVRMSGVDPIRDAAAAVGDAVLSVTTVVSGPASCDTEQGELAAPQADIPAIGPYQEFTRGLAQQSGKSKFCSSVVAMPNARGIFF